MANNDDIMIREIDSAFPPSRIVIIETTFSSEKVAREMAQYVLTVARCAACCHIYPEVRSMYQWEGKLQETKEVVMRIKTDVGRVNQLVSIIRTRHEYTVPQVVVTRGWIEGSPEYEAWLLESSSS